MEDIEMYKKMLEIRKFEEKVYDLFTQNLIPGTMHLYMGQEAVAVGVCAALTPIDFITSTHRGHGHCIAKGASLKKMMAEIFGKKTGYCKGKGGSMHITDKNIGMLGANAVVGGAIPIAVGAGLSCKLKYPERVTVCFFGDGASNQGTFHEGINMASVWYLPVVFVCENNLYAMGTRQSMVMNIEDISQRAAGYGIPGVTVDGNDVMAVYGAAQKAVARARNGEGPTLLECKTYRHKGHSRFDPAKYRPQEEVAEWMARDPIESFREKLLDKGIPEEFLHKIESTVEAEIEEAVEFAEESPLPEPEDALKDIWVIE
ncbi:MAG: pyruvate dehydrogenase (acetyl-transferring) E1 component subunit alpha [Candidatus Methanofastidiosia archaeon]